MYALKTIDETLTDLQSSHEGLADHEVHRRIEEYGFNEIPEKKKSLLLLFLKQFNSVLVYILFAALALSIFLPFYEHGGELGISDFMDAIAIGTILILNACLGFFQEKNAENAIAVLQAMSAPNVRVRRNGNVCVIPSRELVPGDILLLEEGDRISADGRVLKIQNAAVDESSLTGESKPARKQVEKLEGELVVADQTNMVFKGTTVTNGRLEVCVTGTALSTELGKIANLVSKVEHPPTPLENSMNILGRWLGLVVTIFCSIIFLVGFLRGMPTGEMMLAAASLAVSAVPEGLPAIVTVCLAIGVQRMIKRRVLTRELQAIETLGSITVICSDKTGTITENQMEVQEVVVLDGDWQEFHLQEDKCVENLSASAHLALRIGSSCNNAHSLEVGDPTEIGLLEAAQKCNIDRLPILEEGVPFTSVNLYMMTTHQDDAGEINYIKGAAEKVFSLSTHILRDGKEEELSDDLKHQLIKKNEEMASRALRILAMAYQPSLPSDSSDADQNGELRLAGQKNGKTVFVGFIGMMDPPRDGVDTAIATAARAGIRTVMITGDHALTAKAIAGHVGISGDVLTGVEVEKMFDEELQEFVEEVSIFARVSPTHKVRILEALQARGEIVAMGGDGVNDAPALKKAHVGFAMGLRGTDVARETAEIVLTDDHFASVVEAVEEGRTIYDNIRKFVTFLLRANFDELAVVLGAILIGIPLPYLPIHILLINLMTDSLPAMALAMEKPEPNIMQRPPRDPKEHILHGEFSFIFLAAIIATIAAFQIFFYARAMAGGTVDIARTMVVVNSILFELTLVFTCRSRRSLFAIGPFSNRYLVGAVSIAFALLLICLYSPLHVFLHLVPLTAGQWVLPLIWSFGTLAFFEFLKVLRLKRHY